MPEYFEEIELTEEYKGYFCSVKEALAIVILGSFCGLKNIKQIHQWAANPRISEFLREYFKIERIPCYYWLTCLLKLIKPKSLNACFVNWIQSMLPETLEGYTISLDGKTIRSTNNMSSYDNPLHIVSAHIAELGITFGQETVYDKSNEIPAVRELIKLLNLKGSLVVADALNCQKETAKEIVASEADYLLSVKDNQENLKKDIEDYIQDADLRKAMDKKTTCEKNRGRIERRTAYVTNDISWLYGKNEWANLACIGAINTQTTTPKGKTNEWHYFISSSSLTAESLLKHARLEWSVETMHWLLDLHFCEDFCRVEDKDVQQILNIIRKIILNSIKIYKDENNIKRPLSNIMLDCLIDPANLIPLLVGVG